MSPSPDSLVISSTICGIFFYIVMYTKDLEKRVMSPPILAFNGVGYVGVVGHLDELFDVIRSSLMESVMLSVLGHLDELFDLIRSSLMESVMLAF